MERVEKMESKINISDVTQRDPRSAPRFYRRLRTRVSLLCEGNWLFGGELCQEDRYRYLEHKFFFPLY